MPKLTIARSGGWTDRLRTYVIHIDGVPRGEIRAKQTQVFDLAEGPHEVRLRIGPIYSSPSLTVAMEAGGIALECGSNTIPGLAFLALARPNAWIYLRPAGSRPG